MIDYDVWTSDKSPEGINLPFGVTVRWVYDEHYQTEGTYAFDTDEETRAAEKWEQERLENGTFTVLGCVIEDEAGEHLDSLWGIVIEHDEQERVDYFNECMEVPSELHVAEERVERAEHALERARILHAAAMIREAGGEPDAIEDVSFWGFLRSLVRL